MVCPAPGSSSIRSRKISSQQLYSGYPTSTGSALSNTPTSKPILYRSPQPQHQKTGGFVIHGYDTGISGNVRSSSRDSGSSSSRTASRIGSRAGGLPSIANTTGINKRGRNPIRNRPERSIQPYQGKTSPLRNEISKGTERFHYIYN